MILIFGGAYQGKLAYAMKRFGLTDDDVFDCEVESVGVPGGKALIYGVEKWILALVRAGGDIDDALRRFLEECQDAIVICNDISCGVVPEDPALRKWREATGRALASFARASGEVVRLFCGIPTTLK